MQPIILALVGVAAGLLGSMMGLGGGVIVVPVLSLFLGIPIHQAIARQCGSCNRHIHHGRDQLCA